MLKVLLAIFCLMILIFVHELGHFIAAKLFHVQVTAFSLGMGPPIVSKQLGETTYKLCWLPFGGYCAMVGEDGNTENPRSLLNLVWYKRIVIMLAGVFMNFVIAFILLCCLIFPYKNIVVPTISAVSDEVAQAYELELGDTLLNVDGFHVFNANDVAYGDLLDKDGVLNLKVEKTNGVIVSKSYPKTVSLINGLQFTGIEGTAGAKLGQTFKSGASMVQAVVQSLRLLFTGNVHVNEMSGPVGIVKATAEAEDSYSFIYMYAFISINLACMNLLPLPALDGGQALVCLIEGVSKKKVPPKILATVNGATLVLLMLLIAVVSISDITKLFH